MATSPTYGISFSPNQARWLELDPLGSFETCLNWPVSFIRLGAHWDQLETQPGKFEFSSLEPYLQAAEQSDKKIVLTVGVKAPRWPEFYWPKQVVPEPTNPITQQAILSMVADVVRYAADYTCISHWQVENEPLDPSGPQNQVIPLELLQQEINLVRQLDPRPIVLTAWGNDLTSRGHLPTLAVDGDVVGIDLYYRQHLARVLGKDIYRGPADSDQRLTEALSKLSKPVWITELQAEPWEHDGQQYLAADPSSFNLERLQQNLTRAQQLKPEAIFFWGAEYWLWQAAHGNAAFVQFLNTLD